MPGRILLHTCCAPCSCAIIECLLSEGYHPDLYFYNPNIHPFDEYLERKASVIAYARKKELICIDADYEPELWSAQVIGLENEPERGERCRICFEVRLNKTAQYASRHQYDLFATTNGFSRWKDIEQVNAAGRQAARSYSGVTFLERNWRLAKAQETASRIIKEERFYAQSYCGCLYSLQSTLKKKSYPGERLSKQ